jgi:hypothetical protein
MASTSNGPDWVIDGQQPPAWYYLGPNGEPVAAVVPCAEGEAQGLPYQLRVLGSRARGAGIDRADIDQAGVATLEDGLAVVERWWVEINRERSNDNRLATVITDDQERAVPRIATSPLVEQMAGARVWYEYLDSTTNEVLYRRLEGQGPALNQNSPVAARAAGDHLALVHDRDVQQHEVDRGRRR